MKTYRSKVGSEIVIPVGFLLGGIGIAMAYNHIWAGLAMIVLVSVFIAQILLTTYYMISERTILIKCGFLFTATVNIDSIKRISETNNMMSSPAASLDRLEIIYNTYNSILVSPKEKMEFLTHITTINPKIEVKLRDR
jgi:hypothetical protein